ncbi:MAG: efflux RND transporter periplasmic adaptor subunit [Ignavibacteriae bacterium]|nr:MAG: efflux RND transporter periplasmic adaptor subunit [Ignavibacteriota bacterium]
MKLKRPRHLGWIITAVVVVIIIAISLMPTPTTIDVHVVKRERLLSTVDAEAMTRVREKFTVSMPVSGTISRIEVEPGDSVVAGQVIAWYSPPTLDARQRESAIANADAADAQLREAEQRLAATKPLAEQAQRRAERTKRLESSGAIPKEQAENAYDAYMQSISELEAAESRIRMARYAARAARVGAMAVAGQRVNILAPVSGVVLRRYEEQERMVMAGTPLFEIGDITSMELVVDVLSTDAVKVRKGQRVLMEGWGDSTTLVGIVHVIEPAARVKISALGVEEKRVNVIATLEHIPPTLGDGYKADARIVMWEGTSVVAVPMSALVREGGEWIVFVVRDEKAVRTPVKIGHRAALTAEVLSGISPNDVVVLHPPEDLVSGGLVEPRQ